MFVLLNSFSGYLVLSVSRVLVFVCFSMSMNTKEDFVKSELSKFLLQHSPEASFRYHYSCSITEIQNFSPNYRYCAIIIVC